MDEVYARTVRLLLRVAPDVFTENAFVMKGGTAINLFVQPMPRLSVDIDIAYAPWETPRAEALQDVSTSLSAVSRRLKRRGLGVRVIGADGLGDTKLIVDDGPSTQIKIEVNAVFRGTVLPPVRHSLHAVAEEKFSTALTLPILAVDELYGSKLVAALDRQHPRDLFDVWRLFHTQGLSDEMIECFVTYLAGHNRPMHEVLFGRDKDVSREFTENFVGMTDVNVTSADLGDARRHLRGELSRRLTPAQRHFLTGLAHAEPDWTLLRCPHAERLPALQWKLSNLKTFRQRRPDDFRAQARALATLLELD